MTSHSNQTLTARPTGGGRARALIGAAATLGLLGACAAPGYNWSREMTAYEAELRAKGFLRTDVAPRDAPFDNRVLARNFERTHFDREPGLPSGFQDGAPRIRKWAGPVRYKVVVERGRPGDKAEIDALFRRLGGLTGLDVRAATDREDPNFFVFVLPPEERRGLLAVLRRQNAPVSQLFLKAWIDGQVNCGAETFSDEDHVIDFAFAFISGEIGGVMRGSCFHEEIVQSFGMPNDHPDVRPSLANDDEEFAYFTRHDEYLIRLLYDARVRPGMARAQAMPVIRRIVDEIRPRGRVAALTD